MKPSDIAASTVALLLWLSSLNAGHSAELPPNLLLTTNRLVLGKRLSLIVSNAPSSMANLSKDRSKLLLFLDGVPLRGMCTEAFVETNASTINLEFKLERNPHNRTNWTVLLGAPTSFERQIAVNVGTEETGPLLLQKSPIAVLVVIDRMGFSMACSLFVVFGALFLMLAKRTAIIRDPWLASGGAPTTYDPAFLQFLPWVLLFVAGVFSWYVQNGQLFFWLSFVVLLLLCWFWSVTPGNKLRPYSLARTQMAIWFFLVLGAFAFLWLIAGALDSPNSTVLALIGIGAGTAIAAEVQDSSKLPEERSKLTEEKQKLEKVAPPRNKEQEQRLTEITEALAKLTDPPESKHFLDDVLTDQKGISFHRFQMLIWTVVLGIVFVHEVYANLGMPEFSASLLALMGISSGTYLGFMLTEPHSSR